MHCKPPCSEPVPKPGNWDGCSRMGIRCKNTLGCNWCVDDLTFAVVCVAGWGLLVVIRWEVWVRGDQWLTKDLIKSRTRENKGSIWWEVWVRGDQWLTKDLIKSRTRENKGSVGSWPRVLRVSFSCFPGFSLVLDHRGSLGGKVGSACEAEMLYCVNISESSGASSPRLSLIKGG